MKRINNLYERICSLDNLRLADEIARKGKAKQYGVRMHDKNREANLVALHGMLLDKTYKTSPYTVFTIHEPKERLIHRLPYFPDRIVHHAVMNVLEPIFVSTFTGDTYSCIKGRGIHAASKAVRRALKDVAGTTYCLKLDIRKFYPSVDHEVLKGLLRRKLKVPVWYVVDDGIGKTDIAALNSNKKNWSLMDYINYHTIEKRPGFNVLSKFLAEHPKIPISAALALLDPDGIRNTKAVMDGHANVMNIRQAEEIACFLKWLYNVYPLAYNGTVVGVIRQFFDHPDFDPEYFKQKILDQPRSLVKCINTRQYREMFLEIYNYKLSVNRIDLK